jgi:hypothetical protein
MDEVKITPKAPIKKTAGTGGRDKKLYLDYDVNEFLISSDALGNELQLKIKASSGLVKDVTGLGLDIPASSGLEVGSTGLGLKIPASSGLEVGSTGVKINLPALTSGLELTSSGLKINTGLTSGLTTAVVHATEIKDGSGYLYNSTATIAAATTAATKVAATAPAVSATMTEANVTISLLTALTGTGTAATLTYGIPAAGTIEVSGSSAVLSATAGSTTWAIFASDQYGDATQYTPVSVTVAGRNTVATKSIGVTDANGFISYTLTDAGTTGTKDT